jgi:hypothetical protein
MMHTLPEIIYTLLYLKSFLNNFNNCPNGYTGRREFNMNKCTRNDFDELELISGVCKFESVCAIKGLCPMQELINELYASLEEEVIDD